MNESSQPSDLKARFWSRLGLASFAISLLAAAGFFGQMLRSEPPRFYPMLFSLLLFLASYATGIFCSLRRIYWNGAKDRQV